MASVKHAATISSRHSGTRLRILGAVALAILIAVIAITCVMAYPSLVAGPSDYIVWGLCIVVSLVYCQRVSSVETASPHTLFPLLGACIMLQQEQFTLFPLALMMSLIYLSLIYRNIYVGAIHTLGAMFASAPPMLLFSQSGHRILPIVAATLTDQPLSFTSQVIWMWLALAVLSLLGSWIISMLYDTAVWLSLGYRPRSRWSEYSISRILTLVVVDTVILTMLLMLLTLETRQNISWQQYAIAPVTLMGYAIVLQSISTYSEGMRAWRRFEALPTPEALHSSDNGELEEHVLTFLHHGYKRYDCDIVYGDIPATQLFHSYRHSQPVTYRGRSLRLAVRRSIFQPPFLAYDTRVINAIAALVAESLRVDNQLHALRSNDETDLLTGALSYRSFITYLQKLQNNRDAENVAVIYVNIDHFKRINDKYGHIVGNRILHLTAERIMRLVRKDSVLARVGGDEFAIVITGYETRDHIESLANQIHQIVSAPTQTERGMVSIAVSVGVSFAENSGEFNLLLSEATELMYQSRATQQGVGHPNEALQSPTAKGASSVPSEVGVSATVARAIENNTVTVAYQPIFDLESRRIVALTAQARISDPEHGCLPLPFIISEAARLKLSSKLTINLFDQTMTDLEHFQVVVPELHRARMPITGDELTDTELLSRVEQLNVAHPGIQLGLDISEDTLRSLSATILDELENLANIPNINIGLSHLGSGFSEIAAMTQIPATAVSIDKTVISNFRTNNSQELLQKIIQTTGEINISVIFEGVDTAEQAAFVHAVGGRYVQGTFYGSALTAPEFQMRIESIGLGMDSPDDLDATTPTNA